MAKINDKQVKLLWRLLGQGESLQRAALKSGMDRKTARRYRDMKQLPSEPPGDRSWRTREDPFVHVWSEVEEQLQLAPELQAKTLFEWLQQRYPGQFHEGQLRTLQRRVKVWRALQGPPKEVFFSQHHEPGRLGASDFTSLSSLAVTIGGQHLDHLAYHFVLTYSNWESVTLCFSESFESLCEGLQNALWQLGGVPQRHRTDRLSSAVNNLSPKKDFTRRYQGLMQHYGLQMEKTQAGKGHENGDVESLHRYFKDAIDQALLLRGSRDFDSRESYDAFLQQLVGQRNQRRAARLQEERAVLGALPARRVESCQRLKVTVASGSLIRVGGNAYSVHSRLIGEQVEVRIFVEHLEVWYAQKCVDRLPRLRGRGRHRIDYRHVIDWLSRKPGAFARYRYRDDLFPTSHFRMAYDALCETRPSVADREYLQILRRAARDSEARVEEALRALLKDDNEVSLSSVESWLQSQPVPRAVTEVRIAEPDLSCFDALLTEKEKSDECESPTAGASEGTVPADDPAQLRGAGPAGGEGDAQL